MDRASVPPFELAQPASFRDHALFVDFYGLREQPFGVTPDPRFLYLGESHREALAALFYGIESGRGFSALAAEPGMGKTSLLMQLLETMQETSRTAFLFQTEGSPKELLQALLRDLGIATREKGLADTHEALNEVLLAELNAGRRVIVVIDEAQNLSDKALESVRLLSNFETPVAKLMHIVLAGQPKLAQKLAQPSLTQLRQRVSSVIQLTPFELEDTKAYVSHRLRTAGLAGRVPFTADAIALISRGSKGIPRNINNICFQALSLGFASDTRTIGTDMVREVLRDLEIEQRDRQQDRQKEGANGNAANAAPASPQVPAHWPYIPPPEESRPLRNSATYGSSEGTKIFGLLLMVAIAGLLYVMTIANHRDGWNPSQIGDVLFGNLSGEADRPPPIPSRLKPPAAPDIAKTEKTAIEDSARSDAEQSDSAQTTEDEPSVEASGAEAARTHVVSIQRAETSVEIARDYLGQSSWKTLDEIRTLNPDIRGNYQVLPAGTRVMLPGPARGKGHETAGTGSSEKKSVDNSASRLNFTGGSTMVRVYRAETLFQLAMDHYGKSGWEIVRRIRTLNPQLRDPYQLLEQGQWIRVPQVAQER
jgi:general secretion pathway protein A